MKLEDLMKVLDEITPVPPLKIVVSKYVAPWCNLRLPVRPTVREPEVIILGGEAWKQLTESTLVTRIPGEHAIYSFTGVPVTFNPTDWRP